MKYVVECDLEHFEAWSGGRDTLDTLIEKGVCNNVESLIDEINANAEEPMTETGVNDFLWFERDFIAEHLGYSDWDEFEYGDDEEEEEEDDEEEEEEDDEEEEEEDDEEKPKGLLPDALWAALLKKAVDCGRSIKNYIESAKHNFVVVEDGGKAIYWVGINTFDYVVFADEDEAKENAEHPNDIVMTEYDYLCEWGFDYDIYERLGLLD